MSCEHPKWVEDKEYTKSGKCWNGNKQMRRLVCKDCGKVRYKSVRELKHYFGER